MQGTSLGGVAQYSGNSLPLGVKVMSVAASPIVPFPGPRHNQRVQLFSGLEPENMSRIAAHARSMRKTRGEFIYMPGDRADYVYFLKQGRVKLSVLSESGKEIAIDIIRSGEIFGELDRKSTR